MAASLHIADERVVNRTHGRSKGRPAVSVVLVSDGCWQTMERSLSHVARHCRRMLAEVIAIRSGDEAPPYALQTAHPEVRFCSAPVGSSEGQLRTIAMLEASGDIVALRRAADVSDAVWLDAHFRIATGLEPDHLHDNERVVYDDFSDALSAADELSVEPGPGIARRATRHSIETSTASGASSAA